jgi:selenide, water dikinase
MTQSTDAVRLTTLSHGAGCACKLPLAALERLMGTVGAGLDGGAAGGTGELLVGAVAGDDAAVYRLDDARALVLTTDFFTPIVDDARDWGRVAAANALSDVYAMGGRPLVALNLTAWPNATLPLELLAEVLRGGAEVAAEAGCLVVGGHSIDDPEPKYGLAVTGLGDPDRLLRNDAGRPGTPLTLTKPLGLGVLNNRHKATGDVFPEAVATMTTLNRDASRAAVAAGITCATDVTGFGLLGHLLKLVRASGVSAVVESSAVPYLDDVRESLANGFVPGGSRRNLDWVRSAVTCEVDDDELLLLADAQTSGGLLVAGELPCHPVVGELVAGPPAITVR